MTECSVLPVVNTMQAAAAAHPAAEAAAAGFMAEELLPEDIEDVPGTSEEIAVEARLADPLQMLIEDLSGITGALREAMPRLPIAAAPAGIEAAPNRTAARIALTETGDMPFPDLAEMDPAPVGPAQADLAAVEVESLLADPAAPVPATPRDASATPVEARTVRTAAFPVARQIAEAVVTSRDDIIEIALAPEELGRIRMVMSGPEHSPHVMIWAERPEVLEQLRRNAAFLQECFGDAGMADASFEFGGDAQSGSSDDLPAPAPSDRPGFEAAEQMQALPMAWTPMAIPARLDIRI